jgi:hypothetical protein
VEVESETSGVVEEVAREQVEISLPLLPTRKARRWVAKQSRRDLLIPVKSAIDGFLFSTSFIYYWKKEETCISNHWKIFQRTHRDRLTRYWSYGNFLVFSPLPTNIHVLINCGKNSSARKEEGKSTPANLAIIDCKVELIIISINKKICINIICSISKTSYKSSKAKLVLTKQCTSMCTHNHPCCAYLCK